MSSNAEQNDCPRCREHQQYYENRIAKLESQVKHLMDQLQKSHRAGKRQAAPIRKEKKKAEPKRPGRKKGGDYGKQAFRTAPPPEKISEVYEAPLPKRCPDCRSLRLSETHVAQQYQVEIPVEPVYRQFNIHVGCCDDCGARVQGCHELQTSLMPWARRLRSWDREFMP